MTVFRIYSVRKVRTSNNSNSRMKRTVRRKIKRPSLKLSLWTSRKRAIIVKSAKEMAT